MIRRLARSRTDPAGTGAGTRTRMFAAPRRRVRIMSPAVQLEDLTRTRTPTLDLPPGVSDGGVRASVPSGGGPWPGRSQLTAATVAVTVPRHTGTCAAAPGPGAVVTPHRLTGGAAASGPQSPSPGESGGVHSRPSDTVGTCRGDSSSCPWQCGRGRSGPGIRRAADGPGPAGGAPA